MYLPCSSLLWIAASCCCLASGPVRQQQASSSMEITMAASVVIHAGARVQSNASASTSLPSNGNGIGNGTAPYNNRQPQLASAPGANAPYSNIGSTSNGRGVGMNGSNVNQSILGRSGAQNGNGTSSASDGQLVKVNGNGIGNQASTSGRNPWDTWTQWRPQVTFPSAIVVRLIRVCTSSTTHAAHADSVALA